MEFLNLMAKNNEFEKKNQHEAKNCSNPLLLPTLLRIN